MKIGERYWNQIKIQKEYSFFNEQYNYNTSRIFTHAEGHILMQIKDRCVAENIAMPKSVTIYVDRITCSNCRNYQVELARFLGVDTLKFVNANGMQIIYDTHNYKYYFTINKDGTVKKFYYTQGKLDNLKKVGINV